jgi:hypothetical protein
MTRSLAVLLLAAATLLARVTERNDVAHSHFSLAAASFFLEDYPRAWREARFSRAYGFEPPPGFLSTLSAKMPEPR